MCLSVNLSSPGPYDHTSTTLPLRSISPALLSFLLHLNRVCLCLRAFSHAIPFCLECSSPTGLPPPLHSGIWFKKHFVREHCPDFLACNNHCHTYTEYSHPALVSPSCIPFLEIIWSIFLLICYLFFPLPPSPLECSPLWEVVQHLGQHLGTW